MDEEFQIPESWVDKYVSFPNKSEHDSPECMVPCNGSKLAKKDSWIDGFDSPQFTPTPPPTERRTSIMLTHSTSWDDRTEEPTVTRLPSWEEVREQFHYAQEVGMLSGLGELAIREKERFLAEWTMHSLTVARANGPW